MLMFISFPTIVNEWVELGSLAFFNLIEHQPTRCVNILSKHPVPVGASFTRDLCAREHSWLLQKHTMPLGVKEVSLLQRSNISIEKCA